MMVIVWGKPEATVSSVGNAGRAPIMGDARALVSAYLGIESVYVSDDADEVRCVVELHTHGAPKLHEWCVRVLRQEETRYEPTSCRSVNGMNGQSQGDMGGFERQLDAILFPGRHSLRDSTSMPAVEDHSRRRHVLDELYTDIPRWMIDEHSKLDIIDGLASRKAHPRHAALACLRGIVGLGDGVELVFFDYEPQTLQTLLKFNRFLLDDEDSPDAALSDMKRRFLAYQLCEVVSFIRSRGLTYDGQLSPSRIWVAAGTWIRMGIIPRAVWHPANHVSESVERVTTATPTERWRRGDLSNFEYLMILNAAAGRQMIDSVFHPVLPWVTDFSAPHSGWRDLTRSKFRLMKGDNQLDRTYETSAIPHHIPESLSEITYYIYMARRTPMAVLRRVVRSNFQPKEYPQTLQRMYHWTPDECIPELFIDSSVFTSIHGVDTMPDLALPTWASGPIDFIKIHRQMLESAEISASLHKWIDLNFGVCLSGEEALRNKNVPLRVSRKSPGFVQVFEAPHPKRETPHQHHVPQMTQCSDRGSGSQVARDISASLRSAIKIADEAMHEMAPHEYTAGIRHGLPSPTSAAERRGLSSSFVKLKKKQKNRGKSHGSGEIAQPLSPGAAQGPSRSPTVGRFAHAIPRFFGSENSSAATTPDANAMNISDFNSTAANHSAFASSIGPAHPTQDARRSPSSHQAVSGGGNALPPGLLHMTVSNQPSSGTHIFRDLWHQLSKQDDDESIDTADGSSSFIDLDWSEAEYDSLDDIGIQLLRAGASITLPDESGTFLQPTFWDTTADNAYCDALDPAYSLQVQFTTSQDRAALSNTPRIESDDLFALGCIVAEIYTGSHIFTNSSIRQYDESFRGSISTDWEIPPPIGNQLRSIPMIMKSLILGFIHPSPIYRLSAAGNYLGSDASRSNTRLSASPFPPEMRILFRFIGDAHAEEDSHVQLRIVQKHLSSLIRLPDPLLQVSLPVILKSLRFGSPSDPMHAAQACAGIVFCLPDIARRLGTLYARRELLEDVLSVYEQSALPPVLRLALSSPEVIKTIVQTFGFATLIRHFVPVMVDWLTSPVYSNREDGGGRSLQLFSGELSSMVSISLAELGSSDVTGPSVAVKYVLPLLLPNLGKVSSKWLRLIEKRSLIRQDSRVQSATVGSVAAYGGKNGDGIHVAYAPKQVLYENHQIADSILLVCRELPQSVMNEFVLPHLLDVIPRLVDVAESVSSAQIEGVPDDLAREVYVTLRVFRHVIRTLSDTTVQRDILQMRSTILIDLINSIQPPFLHPRTIDAVLSSISDSTKLISNSRYNSTRLKQIRDRLSMFRGERAQDLRAFTAVGVARTITSILQKSGAAATTGAGGVLQSINAFLVRCAAIYSELEVSDFQWKMASEVVSEVCSPLRTLLGSSGFARHFPSVQTSSVLQMLLLPTSSEPPSSVIRDTSRRSLLRQTSSITDGGMSGDHYEAPANIDEVQRIAEAFPDLMQTIYRQSKLNGIKTTGFLHISMRSGSAWAHDLNEDIFLAQEERKKRRAALTSNRAGGDTAWLRPRVKAPYSPRYGESNAEENRLSFESHFGSSWCLCGEVRHSIRAHSSVIRSVAVDLNEEFVVTASKNGSCRTWRLASYPAHSVGTVQIDTPSLLSARMLEDGHRGVALASTALHVWDIRTSQILFKVPFTDDTVTSCMLPHVLPYRHYLDFSPSSRGCSSAESDMMQGAADIIVSTCRKLHLLDARTSPRVVADWRVDAHDMAWISTSAVITTPTTPVGLLTIGTASGHVMLLDKRMGLRVATWQALESRIVKIVQYAPSYVLIVGADREARVWRVDNEQNPALCMIITNIPEGVRDSQVSVQAYSDMTLMYVASSSKLYCTRLIHDASPEAKSSDIITVRLESWSLMDNFYSATTSNPPVTVHLGGGTVSNSPDRSRLHRTKMAVQSMTVLPLRQVILLGGEDGSLRSCI